jgi:hypothetical protein
VLLNYASATSEQSFTGLGPEERCSSWGLVKSAIFVDFLNCINFSLSQLYVQYNKLYLKLENIKHCNTRSNELLNPTELYKNKFKNLIRTSKF